MSGALRVFPRRQRAHGVSVPTARCTKAMESSQRAGNGAGFGGVYFQRNLFRLPTKQGF
jgi:hypothetical protein